MSIKQPHILLRFQPPDPLGRLGTPDEKQRPQFRLGGAEEFMEKHHWKDSLLVKVNTSTFKGGALNGSVTGCQFTHLLGFNWHPFEGAGIYIYIFIYLYLRNIINL